MSVDFKDCNSCKKSICLCGDFFVCYGCDSYWCSKKCANIDGYIQVLDEYKDIDEDKSLCKYCRVEDVLDENLLKFSLELLHINRTELVKRYLDETFDE